MNRTIYAYDIKIKPKRIKDVKKLHSYEEDIVEILTKVSKLNRKKKSKDFKKENKVIFLDHFFYDSDKHIIKLKFLSAKYSSMRTVINTKTFINRGILKKIDDGDLEKSHILIKFEDDNGAIGLSEYTKDGISFSKAIEYINDFIEKNHDNKDMIFYKMSYDNIVSRDFLESLRKLKRIKAVTLTVDQCDIGVSDNKRFAGRDDISNDVDIVLRPSAYGNGILSDTVKEFYKMYDNKNMPIKRITVNGDRETKDPLTFDTEKMKEKYPIEVLQELITGEVDSEDMFEKLYLLVE